MNREEGDFPCGFTGEEFEMLHKIRGLMQYFKRRQRDAYIRPGEVAILHVLEKRPEGMTVSQISAALEIKSPTATQMINSMEQQGLVDRFAHATDKRSVCVRLTQKGQEMLGQLHRAHLNELSAIRNHLGAEKMHQLLNLLAEVADLLEAEAKKREDVQ